MPLAEAVRIVHEAAAALDYAHAQGVIHRDLKPANIMLTAAGQIIVADFGLARIAGSTRVTMTGAILGTPAYMSPEQILGSQVDARSDIYSLGVVLYEMVTGRLLFEGATPMEIIMKHLRELTSHQPNLGASLPGAIEPVILKALAKEPDDRHQSAGELAESLARAYAGDLSAHGSADNC